MNGGVVAEARGPQPSRGWRITAIEGHLADLEYGGARLRLPLWLLHRDRAVYAPPPPRETFTEPRWLIDIAQEMLVAGKSGTPYPQRGAVARAVKQYRTSAAMASTCAPTSRAGPGSPASPSGPPGHRGRPPRSAA